MPQGDRSIIAVRAIDLSPDRCEVVCDDGTRFEVSIDVAVTHTLRTGKQVSEDLLAQLLADEEVSAAVRRAVAYMHHRPRTVKELRQYLRRRGYSVPTVDAAIRTCQERGYLNDRQYAEMFVGDRQRNRPAGRRLLEMELQRRGVPRSIVDDVLSTSKMDERAMAQQLFQKKLSILGNSPSRSDIQKIANFLQRRGFTTSMIMDVMREALQGYDS